MYMIVFEIMLNMVDVEVGIWYCQFNIRLLKF